MKAPKFCENWADDNHCLQASVRMVLGGGVGWNKVNQMTDYREGLYSWTPAGAVALSEKIPGVKLMSMLDYKKFAERGGVYLQELWARDASWYELQKNHASPGFAREQKWAKTLIKRNIFAYGTPTSADLERFLADQNFIIAVVNSARLAHQKGDAGHFVLLYDQDGDHFVLHDPGLPPHKAWKVDKGDFMAAFRGELIMIPTRG